MDKIVRGKRELTRGLLGRVFGEIDRREKELSRDEKKVALKNHTP
jgi:hypothetical protein